MCRYRSCEGGGDCTAATVTWLYGHLRQVVSQRHVLGELFLRDPLLHLELAVFDTADVAVNDADMIFLADDLVALRMRERVLHLHAFERLDYSFDILAGLVARGLDRLLDCENIFPCLPAVALVHH